MNKIHFPCYLKSVSVGLLRSDVEQFGVWFAAVQVIKYALPLTFLYFAVNCDGRNAQLEKMVYLIFDECNERGHNNSHFVDAQQGRQLVAQGLACARWHANECVAVAWKHKEMI